MLLDQKVAVITGAGSGVGRAAALRFAGEGAAIVAADIRQDWARETADRVQKAGGSACPVVCDVTSEPDVALALAAAREEFGRLDVVFNNAGVATKRFGIGLDDSDNDDDELERLISVNFKSVVYGCRHALRIFKEQGGGGVIVNTGSMAGVVAAGGALYGATKAAVIQLTRSVAIEGAPHGVRANCVCPGAVDTNFGVPAERAFLPKPAESLARTAAAHPLGRVIAAEEVADAALYLASDLSSNVTGVMLPVDGGYLAK